MQCATCTRASPIAAPHPIRWHDLRHAWASWHVQGGTPLFALQELSGWESPLMVRRYAHLFCGAPGAPRGTPLYVASRWVAGLRHKYGTGL